MDSWVEVEKSVKATNVDDSWAELPTENTGSTSTTDPGTPEIAPVDKATTAMSRSYEEGIIKGLQEAVLARMEKNGPITDQMRRDVEENVYHDSLINWIKSF